MCTPGTRGRVPSRRTQCAEGRSDAGCARRVRGTDPQAASVGAKEQGEEDGGAGDEVRHANGSGAACILTGSLRLIVDYEVKRY